MGTILEGIAALLNERKPCRASTNPLRSLDIKPLPIRTTVDQNLIQYNIEVILYIFGHIALILRL